MGLLAKVRILIGALVHAPFTPRPEKVNLDEGSVPASSAPGTHPASSHAADPGDLESHPASAEPLPDTDRVADLIARRKGDA